MSRHIFPNHRQENRGQKVLCWRLVLMFCFSLWHKFLLFSVTLVYSCSTKLSLWSFLDISFPFLSLGYLIDILYSWEKTIYDRNTGPFSRDIDVQVLVRLIFTQECLGRDRDPRSYRLNDGLYQRYNHIFRVVNVRT